MNKDELSETDTIVSRKLCYLSVHYALSPLAQADLNFGLIIITIIHKFSIALFPAERAQRACSHTCT